MKSRRDLIKQGRLAFQAHVPLIEIMKTKECSAKEKVMSESGRDIIRSRKAADEARKIAVEQLKQRYFETGALADREIPRRQNCAMSKDW